MAVLTRMIVDLNGVASNVKLALLQLNPTVGALEENAHRIIESVRAAERSGAELAVTTELAVAGYLPRDLLLRPSFIESCWQAVQKISGELSGSIPVLVGVPLKNPGRVGRSLFNAAVLLQGGRVCNTFYKTLMPTYDVFDEDRYFEPGTAEQVLEFKGRRLGVSICEDLWNDRDFWERPRYHVDPI